MSGDVTSMSNEEIFKSISADISSGNTEGVSQRILSLSESSDDPFELLKCMSLLKLLPNDGTESKIANRLVAMADTENGFEIATALYNLGCPYFSYQISKDLDGDDRVKRLRCHCLVDMEEYESAMECYPQISNPVINDRIMLSAIQSAVGEHKQSLDTSSALLKENPKDYDVRVAYVTSLMLGGHDREAVKYVREGLKDKSADSNAIAAYVMRIQGNVKAAGGYAARAVQKDNQHIGALETLGICLALSNEYDKARITAGAINEISPGNKAAMNILSYCEGH